MDITKKKLYKLLAVNTRGEINSVLWKKALKIFFDVLEQELINGNIIYTPIGIFEVRESSRKISGFKEDDVAYEKRCEIKYKAPDKLKERLNARK